MISGHLTARIGVREPLRASISSPQMLSSSIAGFAVIRRGFPEYPGPFEFTPSEETQVIPTEETSVYQNITIAPIPSDYGRIAWNGAGIIVY